MASGPDAVPAADANRIFMISCTLLASPSSAA
jgi:hypothetical protein